MKDDKTEHPMVEDLIDLNAPIEEISANQQKPKEEPHPAKDEDDDNDWGWIKWVIWPINLKFGLISWFLPKGVKKTLKKMVNDFLGD